ncbi:MAG: hypothetical protein WD095_01570 [Candidatus Paceibacterota bacterium]
MTKKAYICLILAFLLLMPSIGSSQTIKVNEIINIEGIPDISAKADTDTILEVLKKVLIKTWDLSKQLLSTMNDWLEDNFDVSLISLGKLLLNVIVGIVVAVVDLVKSLIP